MLEFEKVSFVKLRADMNSKERKCRKLIIYAKDNLERSAPRSAPTYAK